MLLHGLGDLRVKTGRVWITRDQGEELFLFIASVHSAVAAFTAATKPADMKVVGGLTLLNRPSPLAPTVFGRNGLRAGGIGEPGQTRNCK